MNAHVSYHAILSMRKACLQAGTIAILQTYNSVTATAAALPRLRLSTILQILRKGNNKTKKGSQLKQRSQRRNHLHCTGNSKQSWAAAQPAKTQYLHRLVQRILEKNVSDFWQHLLRIRLRADELHQLVLCTYFISPRPPLCDGASSYDGHEILLRVRQRASLA